jgi:molybdenum cofactor synthesis domain-containing protein
VFTAAVLTLSDKGSRGERDDVSGKLLADMLASISGTVETYAILPDEKRLIEEQLIYYADHIGIDVIATTGGTGVGPRDVTPD